MARNVNRILGHIKHLVADGAHVGRDIVPLHQQNERALSHVAAQAASAATRAHAHQLINLSRGSSNSRSVYFSN